METIVVILMVALFVILMIFVFSVALLTPIIGKRNLLFVVAIGFIVGLIGGEFFIAPVVEDIPGLASAFYLSTSSDLETVNADVSTNIDTNQFIQDTQKIDGVKSVTIQGVTLKTTPFSSSWQSTLPSRIPLAIKGIKSVQIPYNDTMEVQIQDQNNTPDIINKLEKWLVLVSGISVKYSTAHAVIQVESSKASTVSNQISNEAVITGTSGPTQDKINFISSIIPNNFDVVILCGFIGMFTGLAGVFIDTLAESFSSIKNWLKRKDKEE